MAGTAKLSGKGGSFKINSTVFNVSHWEADLKADTPDSTDSGTAAGYKSHVIGRAEGEISIKGYVATDDLPSTKIEPGTALSTCEFLIDGTHKIAVALATAQSLKIGAPIGSGETVSFDAQVKINGAWTPLA